MMSSDGRGWWKALFDLAEDGIVVHELMRPAVRARFRQVNPAACRMLGYSRAEMLRMAPVDVIAPDDQEGAAHVDRVLHEQGRVRHERILFTRDGRRIPCEVVSRRFERDGQQMVFSIIRDVTERKRARRELKESEERFRLAASAAHLGSFSRNHVTGENHWSPEFLAIYGLEEDAELALREDIPATVHPEDRARVLAETGALSGAEEDVEFSSEHRIIRPDGTVCWVLVRGHIEMDANGRPIRSHGFAQDITERKQREEQLQRSREDLRRAQAVGRIGSWRLDLESDTLDWSDQTYRIFGIPEGTPLTYERFLQAVHPDDRQFVDAKWAAGLEGEPYDLEHRVVVDGETRWVREKAYLEFDERGQVTGGFGISQDITERKRAREELHKANETLEQRVAERTEEVRSQADQLRALASRLSQAEQRERKRLAGILHDHVQQYIVAAQMQIEDIVQKLDEDHVRSTARDALDILEEAFHATRTLSVDLCPPVLNAEGLGPALDWLAERMEQKHGFRVEVRHEPMAGFANEETKLLLFECARELLFNAVKHAGVSEARVDLSETPDGEVRLTVSDGGDGFDARMLDDRGPEEATFGLFSIRERLTYMGGAMQIDAEPGGGTCITLTVPRAAQPQEPAVHPEQKPEPDAPWRAAGGTIRVIVADDHEAMRRMLVNRLAEEEDMEVVGQVATGEDAVRLARRTRPDVLVMDLRLPGMDGAEATQAIRRECSDVRVIGHTAYGGMASEARAIQQAGAAACVRKDSSCEQLIRAIRDCTADGAEPGSVEPNVRRRRPLQAE
jgi:PAS domain S-box-containing protein